VNKFLEMIRMSTRFDREWTHSGNSTEANVSVLTAAWKVAKHCADEDGKLKQLDDHYFHKELNESIFLLEQGEEFYSLRYRNRYQCYQCTTIKI